MEGKKLLRQLYIISISLDMILFKSDVYVWVFPKVNSGHSSSILKFRIEISISLVFVSRVPQYKQQNIFRLNQNTHVGNPNIWKLTQSCKGAFVFRIERNCCQQWMEVPTSELCLPYLVVCCGKLPMNLLSNNRMK